MNVLDNISAGNPKLTVQLQHTTSENHIISFVLQLSSAYWARGLLHTEYLCRFVCVCVSLLSEIFSENVNK